MSAAEAAEDMTAASNWMRGSELRNNQKFQNGNLPKGTWQITKKQDGKRGFFPGRGNLFYSSSAKPYNLPVEWVDKMPNKACEFEIVAGRCREDVVLTQLNPDETTLFIFDLPLSKKKYSDRWVEILMTQWPPFM